MEGASEESVRAAGLAVETCLKKLLGVALALVLTSAASAQAEGFNVNSSVTFVPLPATFRTSADTTGCPADFAGKFTLKALLTNKPASPAMPGIAVRVHTLTNGNILLDPQTEAILGGPGAVMEVPKVAQYADGMLSPGESVEVPFILCLTAFQPFQFFVDVSGIVTELVSINRFGTDSGNNSSGSPGTLEESYAISADGRYVAFASNASDLVANDNNQHLDVFVRDLQTGTTTLVSVNQLGTNSGNIGAFGPSISADGRFVAFASASSDLVANDNNQALDVFVRDLQTGTTTLVSVNRLGTNAGNAGSGLGKRLSGISADGRFVLFPSEATDLVTTDTNGRAGLFVRDLAAGITRWVTSSAHVLNATLSANGRFVAFDESPSGLGEWNVFVWDWQTGIATLASVNRFGTNSGNGNYSVGPVLSADGRFVAFQSDATDLVAIDDFNGGPSSNGQDVFVRDLQTGTTTLASINRFGTSSGNGDSSPTMLSADGRFVLFNSQASDLVENDTNGTFSDAFIRDLQTGMTTLVSVNQAGTGSGNRGGGFGASLGGPLSQLSADGRFVAFMSFSSDLTAIEDTNFVPGGPGPGGSLPRGQDVFVRDLQMGTTAMVSVNRSGTNGGNHNSTNPILSADGRFVVFESEASDLVGADSNGARDVFVRPVQ